LIKNKLKHKQAK